MKNVYMTVLLCATGLVATNGSFAATATVEQWSNSVKSYPERRPDFNVEQYYNSGSCIAHEHNINYRTPGLPDKIYTGGYESLVFKKQGDKTGIGLFYDFNCDDDECSNGTIVAIAWDGWTNEYDHGSGYTPRYDPVLNKKNYKWKCETDLEFAGWDEWVTNAAIPDCKNDQYQIFKNKTNIISYLYDRTISGNTLYRAIVNPSEHVCITYACAPGYKPNMDVEEARITSANSDQLKCIGPTSACTLYSNPEDRKVDGEEYPNIIKKAKCNDGAYFDINGASPDDPNATHGTQYIEKLRDHMNAQLAANITVARNLYNRRPDKERSSYECDDTGCKLKKEILKAGETECDYLCTDNGFAVKLHQSSANDPCPMYFKQQYDTQQHIYVCNFDESAVAGKIGQMDTDAANAAAQQRAECAKLFCEKSGGVYKDNTCQCGVTVASQKMCSEDNDNTGDVYKGYNYCTSFRGNGCEKGVWSVNKRVPNDEEIKSWKSDLTKCIDAADAAADSTAANTDTISTLAGRLAKVEDQFGLSKWRTADGKFNTARLASDLTAGVVLGTTGALVTSSVVKKKQVKDGFESLECTVGGQHVGDWGDVFRIDGK